MRSVTHSDSDDVLSGRREPAHPFELGRVKRGSPGQTDIEHAAGFLEDMVIDLQDAVGMASPGDLDGSVWRLIDRIAATTSRLAGVEAELRRQAP